MVMNMVMVWRMGTRMVMVVERILVMRSVMMRVDDDEDGESEDLGFVKGD